MTLNEINNIIKEYFTPKDETPNVCHISTVYMALRILESDIEKMANEYDNLLPEDIKNNLAQIHFATVQLQNLLK